MKPVGLGGGHAALGVNCGTCVYHQKLVKYNDTPCAQQGVLPFALAPGQCYRPDVSQLVGAVDQQVLADLGRNIAKLPADKLRLLGFVLSTAAKTLESEGCDLKFGQPVVFSLGLDYVSHYFRGIFTDAHDGMGVVVSTLTPGSPKPTTIELPLNKLMSRSQWRVHCAALIEQGLIYAPEVEDGKKLLPDLLTYQGMVDIPEHVERARQAQAKVLYEPPSIDLTPDDMLARIAASTPKKKKGEKVPSQGASVDYAPEGTEVTPARRVRPAPLATTTSASGITTLRI